MPRAIAASDGGDDVVFDAIVGSQLCVNSDDRAGLQCVASQLFLNRGGGFRWNL